MKKIFNLYVVLVLIALSIYYYIGEDVVSFQFLIWFIPLAILVPVLASILSSQFSEEESILNKKNAIKINNPDKFINDIKELAKKEKWEMFTDNCGTIVIKTNFKLNSFGEVISINVNANNKININSKPVFSIFNANQSATNTVEKIEELIN